MSDIKFREMTPDDAEDVAAIEAASFSAEFSLGWSRDAFYREATNDLSLYIVAVDDSKGSEKIVGYAGVWLIADEAQIMNVAVAPDHRGKKISNGLMTELIARSKEKGATRMTLEVRPSNTPALALYASFGFKEYGRRPHYYQDNGEDAIIMWNMRI
ncbi:MAG: ribosomal protein S18-alanine N-acetyltransferase [Selenomonadaceae bacterium]